MSRLFAVNMVNFGKGLIRIVADWVVEDVGKKIKKGQENIIVDFVDLKFIGLTLEKKGASQLIALPSTTSRPVEKRVVHGQMQFAANGNKKRNGSDQVH